MNNSRFPQIAEMQQLVRYYEPAWSEFITWQRCANLVRSESFLRMKVIILLTLMRCWEEWSVLTIIWLSLSRVLWPTQSCWLFIKYLIVTATILNSSNPENISQTAERGHRFYQRYASQEAGRIIFSIFDPCDIGHNIGVGPWAICWNLKYV